MIKYFNELTKLDENDMLMIDYMYQDRFQKWGYNPLEKAYKKDLSLPVDLDYEPVIQFDETSTSDGELKQNDNLIDRA